MKLREDHSRSVAKGVTYTGAVIIADIAIILIVTHHLDTTIELIILTNIVSLGIYYLHARIWTRIPWGMRRSSK